MVRGTSTIIALALAARSGMAARAAAGEPDLTGERSPENGIWLDALDLAGISQEWGSPQKGKSVEGKPMTVAGKVYRHGIGTHASSEWSIDLKGAAENFLAVCSLDDEAKGQGSVVFEVLVDGREKARTGTLRGGDPKEVSVDLRGAKRLTLVVDDAGDGINGDHADWAGAAIVMEAGSKARPEPLVEPPEPPPAVASSGDPRSGPAGIHGPRAVGGTPGRPFLFLVPATGEPPIAFSARGLPDGLSIDEATGVISGSLKADGETTVEVTARNDRGEARRKLRIVAGIHKLAQTPPLGWNSWNVWMGTVNADKVIAAAEAMVRTGLAAHGFQYVNIDDTWEGKRNARGEIQTNEKFPDMRALADHVHALGLKLGIYSSPGATTCGGFEGSLGHEEQDAATWAKWGIDYVKHDWCFCESKDLKEPYRVMRTALDKADRDIVYSMCQYGKGDVWTWGGEVGGNLWRTTFDILDNWGSMADIGFSQDGHEKYAGPGRWNDPDMLVVGKLSCGLSLHSTHLTANEQITHITLWCLLAAPLLIGCDLQDMDRFTLDILTNDEVLDVDQDPLGKAAGRKTREGTSEVWARPLFDGTTAVGLFNRSRRRTRIAARWADLGIEGPQPVRDLWLRKDLGPASGSFEAEVPGHGAVLVKIGAPRAEER